MSALFARLLDVVYPRACAGCGHPADGAGDHLCWDCLARIEVVTPPFCRLCGDPADGSVEETYECSGCRGRATHFERARSAARYRGVLRDVLQAFKYARATHLAGDLAQLLAACVETHYRRVRFDAVTYVPLYPARQRHRTYNQARLLAAAAARRLGLPLLPRALQRARLTETQTDLNARQRRLNVRGAFRVRDAAWAEGRRFLLVDDVMTTGATVAECSRVLKEAGAAGVYVVTVARG